MTRNPLESRVYRRVHSLVFSVRPGLLGCVLIGDTEVVNKTDSLGYAV
jgi:hypothetical protein